MPVVTRTGFAASLPSAVLVAGDSRKLVSQDTFRRDLFAKMLDAGRTLATTAGKAPSETARHFATETLDAEIARLEDLATRNPHVPAAELAGLRKLREETLAALAAPRLRLDSLRLIWCS